MLQTQSANLAVSNLRSMDVKVFFNTWLTYFFTEKRIFKKETLTKTPRENLRIFGQTEMALKTWITSTLLQLRYIKVKQTHKKNREDCIH